MAESHTDRIAAEVRAEMARRRVNQREVGEILGLPQSQVSRRLRGVIAFNTDELGRLADAWSVPVSTFTSTPARVA
jgi:transcriptional regulator with XRE-family HTH domain